MSLREPAPAKTTFHPEHLADRAAMLAMRAMIDPTPSMEKPHDPYPVRRPEA